MPKKTGAGRSNQRIRARKDLLLATARLLKNGRTPTLEEVASEALVSRATAYRYFPNIEALLFEAALDITVPEAEELFANAPSLDPVKRLEQVDSALEKVVVENEAPLRMMLAHSLQRRARGDDNSRLPIRQNRRTPLIQAALAPARKTLDPKQLDRLEAALALIMGTEAMVVFRDVLQVDDQEARNVKQWAIRALIDAARKPDGRNPR